MGSGRLGSSDLKRFLGPEAPDQLVPSLDPNIASTERGRIIGRQAGGTLRLCDLDTCQPSLFARRTSPQAARVTAAIDKGRGFLSELTGVTEPDYVWIEKVTYMSKNFHKAYILAALNAPLTEQNLDGKVRRLFHVPWERIEKLQKLSRRLPLLASVPNWTTKASLIESYLFLPQLQEIRLDIFPRKDMAEDKYFEYIPFAWTAINNSKRTHLRGDFLYEMMIISFLNYQADEYMETCVNSCFAGRLGDVRCLVDRLFDWDGRERPGHSLNVQNVATDEAGVRSDTRSVDTPNREGCTSKKRRLAGATDFSTNGVNDSTDRRPQVQEVEITETLGRFVGHVLNHPKVQTASMYDKNHLRRELRNFLLAHIDQIEDNSRLSSTTNGSGAPERTFFDWVRRTGSDHTSCPYSFSFALCLLGNGGDFFDSCAQKYYAQAACQHLATLCRMYNDIGSMSRDREENNLNSLDFPEFCRGQDPQKDVILKAQLYQLASHERKCLDMAIDGLKPTNTKLMERFLQTFVAVTDLFGQIYVEKDIASRMK